MLIPLRRIIGSFPFVSDPGAFLWSILLVLSVLSGPVVAGESDFTARFIHYNNGEPPASEAMTGTIMVRDRMIRMETEERGRQLIRIFRPDDGLIFEIHPHKKSYNELPYMAGASWFNRHEILKGALQQQGTETISGELCDHYATPMNIAAVWISQALHFPIRSILNGEVDELRDIHLQSLSESLFTPPAGYTIGISYPGLQKKIAQLSHAQTPQATTDQPAPESGHDKPKPTFTPLPRQSDAGAQTAAFPLGIQVHPGNTGRSHSLEQPLTVSFSQPVPAGFFTFTIEPDPGTWKEEWQDDQKKVHLQHDSPFKDNQLYKLTINVLGEPAKHSRFTANDRSSSQRIVNDLNKEKIDINQAATYQLFQVFRPSSVPEQYRLKKAPTSGTPAFRKARRNYHRLDEKTRKKLGPFFLSPKNPQSYWHSIVHQPLTVKNGWNFSLVPSAYADQDLLREVYITDTGFKVVIMGAANYSDLVHMARELVEEKKMYEKFEQLMGRTTPHPGDRELLIYIVHSIESLEDREAAKKKGEPDPEPLGWCGDFPYDPDNPASDDEDNLTGIPEIFISAGENVVQNMEETRRRLGATLAHEMFHAFQCAFDRETDTWAEEATAVWAENYIDRSWNTEQDFIPNAFNSSLNSLKDLESEDDDTPYGMYLFPLFLTDNRPGDEDIIRQIWEGISGGLSPIKAVKHSLGGDFDEVWKEYALATLDESPESGKFNDNPNRWGNGPLVLNSVHEYDEFSIEASGTGGTLVFLDQLSATYLKAVNEHEGPDAPAIRFDLTDFQQDETVSVQAVVVYRDGRREYEDWSDREKRVFCLSTPKQNFSEIYIVTARSADDKKEENEFWLNIYPESEEDCLKGSASMTLKIYGNEQRNIKKRYGAEIEQGSSSWSETVTVQMGLELWREDIPPQLRGILKQMPALYPEVDKGKMAEARKSVEGAARAPVQYKDPNTGSLVMKYRVTSLNVTTSSGRKRLTSLNKQRDGMGLTSSCSVTYSETLQLKGLDENAREQMKKRRFKVEIFIDPETGAIRWVRLPMVGTEKDIIRVAKSACTKRYKDKRGFYHYKNEDNSWNDTQEGDVILNFDSDSEEREGEPLDPIWKSEMRSRTTASGRGQKVRLLDREWNEPNFNGYIKGKETTEFSWRLNLENVPKR